VVAVVAEAVEMAAVVEGAAAEAVTAVERFSMTRFSWLLTS
jgi:hypothetical protein